MRTILTAAVVALGLLAGDYRLDPADFPPVPTIGTPEAESWAHAAELSVKAHRLQLKTDRAWLRARQAWLRYETEQDSNHKADGRTNNSQADR